MPPKRKAAAKALASVIAAELAPIDSQEELIGMPAAAAAAAVNVKSEEADEDYEPPEEPMNEEKPVDVSDTAGKIFMDDAGQWIGRFVNSDGGASSTGVAASDAPAFESAAPRAMPPAALYAYGGGGYGSDVGSMDFGPGGYGSEEDDMEDEDEEEEEEIEPPKKKGKGKAPAKGKGKAPAKPKGKGKGKAPAKSGKAKAVIKTSKKKFDDSDNDAIAAQLREALLKGNAHSVCRTLRSLLPAVAIENCVELRCLKRALTQVAATCQKEVVAKRKELLENPSEKELMVGKIAVPVEVFSRMLSYLTDVEAVRTSATSVEWHQITSRYPQWQHINYGASSTRYGGKRQLWSDMINQLKFIKSRNPWRTITKLTTGHYMKIGVSTSLPKELEYIDITRRNGSDNFDPAVLVKSHPKLKGLAMTEDKWGMGSGFMFVATPWMLQQQVDQNLRTLGAGLKNLESLYFTQSLGGTRGLSRRTVMVIVGSFPRLKKLRLGSGMSETDTVGDYEMRQIATGMPELERLYLRNVTISNMGWEAFVAVRKAANAPLISIELNFDVARLGLPTIATMEAVADITTEGLYIIGPLPRSWENAVPKHPRVFVRPNDRTFEERQEGAGLL